MQGAAFSQCTACSPAVVDAYRADGWAFIDRVLSQPSWLEEVTGLAQLHAAVAAMDLKEQQKVVAAGAAAAGGGEQSGQHKNDSQGDDDCDSGDDDDWMEL